VNAKVKSEQYAWEAHRSINKVTKEMETKIKSKAMDTKDKMKQSVEEATLSTKERIKDEVSKRMESFKLPSSLFGGGSKGNFASPSSGGGGAQTLTKSASTTSQQAGIYNTERIHTNKYHHQQNTVISIEIIKAIVITTQQRNNPLFSYILSSYQNSLKYNLQLIDPTTSHNTQNIQVVMVVGVSCSGCIWDQYDVD